MSIEEYLKKECNVNPNEKVSTSDDSYWKVKDLIQNYIEEEELVKNLSLGVVMPSLLEEEKLEPIQNALYATMQMTTDQATDIAEGILTYIKDHCYDIVKTNEA